MPKRNLIKLFNLNQTATGRDYDNDPLEWILSLQPRRVKFRPTSLRFTLR
jgi:hypothetical protein